MVKRGRVTMVAVVAVAMAAGRTEGAMPKAARSLATRAEDKQEERRMLAFNGTSAECQVDQYYAGIKALMDKQDVTSQELMNALNALLANTAASSVTTSDALWAAVEFLDKSETDASKIKLTYTGLETSVANRNDAIKGWVRGRIVPTSYGIRDTGSDAFDLYNIRAVNGSIASRRGDRYFGWCENEANCLRPIAAGAPFDVTMDIKGGFTPAAKTRGDIARAVFYMATRYMATTSTESKLELTNCPSKDNNQFLFGKLATLLEWHHSDPADASEKSRNDAVCTKFQKNRNPFVDIPGLAEKVFCQAQNSETGKYVDPVSGCPVVVTPNCGGPCQDVGGLMYEETKEPVSCGELASQDYCAYSLVVRERCRATCGMCTIPICADSQPSGLVWDDTEEDAPCAEVVDFCTEQFVADSCPKTCGICSVQEVAQVPKDVEELIPTPPAENRSGSGSDSAPVGAIILALSASTAFVVVVVGFLSMVVFKKKNQGPLTTHNGQQIVVGHGQGQRIAYNVQHNLHSVA